MGATMVTMAKGKDLELSGWDFVNGRWERRLGGRVLAVSVDGAWRVEDGAGVRLRTGRRDSVADAMEEVAGALSAMEWWEAGGV